MLVRFIRVIHAQVVYFWVVFTYMNILQFIHSHVALWHEFLAIMKTGTKNILVQDMCTYVFMSSG